MKNSVQISKIQIKIGQKDLILSLEEAKELKDKLCELFTQRVVLSPDWPVYIPYDNPAPLIPPYIPYWEVTCSADTITFTDEISAR